MEAKRTLPVSTLPSSSKAQVGLREKMISQTITAIIMNHKQPNQ